MQNTEPPSSSQQRTFACTQQNCSKSFFNNYSLRRHLRLVHNLEIPPSSKGPPIRYSIQQLKMRNVQGVQNYRKRRQGRGNEESEEEPYLRYVSYYDPSDTNQELSGPETHPHRLPAFSLPLHTNTISPPMTPPMLRYNVTPADYPTESDQLAPIHFNPQPKKKEKNKMSISYLISQ
jgi:hypothetical protein